MFAMPDPDDSIQEVVKNCKQACVWLEEHNLLVPLEATTITLPMLSTTLFHIAELAKMPANIALAIRLVAWLVGEVEVETVAEATRTVVNDQIVYLNSETKDLLDVIRTTMSEEVERNISNISTAVTKVLEEKTSK